MPPEAPTRFPPALSITTGAHDYTSRLPNSLGDVLKVLGNGTQNAGYLPDGTVDTALDNDGTVTVTGQGEIRFAGLEPVDIQGFGTVSVTLPGGVDDVTFSSGSDASTGLDNALVMTGTSGTVAFESLHVRNVTTLSLDTAAAPGSDGADIVTIDAGGADAVAAGVTNLAIDTGAGADAVDVNGPAMISGDVTIDTGGDVNFNDGGQILAVGTSTIGITAGGSILETGPDAGLELLATRLNLTTIDGSIGTLAETLEIDAGSGAAEGLTLAAGGTGQAALVDINALRVLSATTNDGAMGLVAGALGGGDLTVQSATAGGSGDLLLASLGGSVHLDTVTAAGNLVGIGTYGGAVTDLNGASNNVTAAALIVSAETGIGAADALETTVGALAAENNTSGDVWVNNTGPLTIMELTVPGQGTVTGVSSAGNAVVSASTALTAAEDVTADGDVVLTAADTAAVDTDNVTLAAGVAVTADNLLNTATVTINAGDDVMLAPGRPSLAIRRSRSTWTTQQRAATPIPAAGAR